MPRPGCMHSVGWSVHWSTHAPRPVSTDCLVFGLNSISIFLGEGLYAVRTWCNCDVDAKDSAPEGPRQQVFADECSPTFPSPGYKTHDKCHLADRHFWVFGARKLQSLGEINVLKSVMVLQKT